MRLPDDYQEENAKGLTPTVLSAVVAVTLFVAALFVVVLLMNRRDVPSGSVKESASQSTIGKTESGYPDTDSLLSGSTLSPDDLDFWDKYPTSSSSEEASTQESSSGEKEVVTENDPKTDGKHTCVVNRDGKEEWVLISPYLPKHEYDFTKLVCQSDLMKYYVDGKQVSFVGATISKHQDYVDYVKAKKAGLNYVMIRVGSRGYGSGQLVEDDFFADNLKRASDAGLGVGVYFTSQAITEEEVREEAEFVLEKLDGAKLNYPVVFDMGFVENDKARIEDLTKAERTNLAKIFLDTIAENGYMPMIYGDKEWLIKEIDMSKLTGYDVWLEQCQDVPDYPYRFTMWNYTDMGEMDGIVGCTSLSISFIDYSEK